MSRSPKTVHTVPANPGFTLWWVDEEKPELEKGEPIVGWLVEEIERDDGSSIFWNCPITTLGVIHVNQNSQAYAIECPDLRICFPEETIFKNIDAFLDFLKAKARDRRKAG